MTNINGVWTFLPNDVVEPQVYSGSSDDEVVSNVLPGYILFSFTDDSVDSD